MANGHGGKRTPGPGKKNGRPTSEEAKAKQRAIEEASKRQAVNGEEIMPLDYLLSVVRDKKAKKKDRIYCANAAAPYCHKKKPQAIEGNISGDFKFEVVKYADGKVPDSA